MDAEENLSKSTTNLFKKEAIVYLLYLLKTEWKYLNKNLILIISIFNQN